MKKLISLFIALIMAISVFAFSACGGNNNNNNNNDNTPAKETTENTEELKVKGSIDGNYTKLELNNETEEFLGGLFEGLSTGDTHPAVTEDMKAGGNGEAQAKITLKIGDKSLTLSADLALALILALDEKGVSGVDGAALNSEFGLKADEGFGAALNALGTKFYEASLGEDEVDENLEENQMILGIMSLIDNFDINAKLNAYVADKVVEEDTVKTVYADAQVTGIPEFIKDLIPAEAAEYVDFDAIVASLNSGLKYYLTEDEIKLLVATFIGGMFGGGDKDDMMSNQPQAVKFEENLEEPSEREENRINFEDILETLLPTFEFSAEQATDGSMKIKCATTDDTKAFIITYLKHDLISGEDVPALAKAIINSIVISKLDVELYIAVNADGDLTAVAGKVDIDVSLTAFETPVSLTVKGAANVSFEVPESIEYPSFEGYQDLLPILMPAEDNAEMQPAA